MLLKTKWGHGRPLVPSPFGPCHFAEEGDINGLQAAGVERDDRGTVKIDERCRTTAPGVWAVGDCAGSPHFTHIADDDVRVVRDNLAGIDRTTGRLLPFCLFTDPALARSA